jgi:hypothetical protein
MQFYIIKMDFAICMFVKKLLMYLIIIINITNKYGIIMIYIIVITQV